MSSSKGSSLAPATSRIVVWAALLVLTLGLQRLLVVCTGPHCDGRIELVHASSGCCEHRHAQEGTVDADGDQACAEHGGCTDVALPVEPVSLPKTSTLDLEDQPCLVPVSIAVPTDRHGIAPALRPPTTGPPRTDQHTALRASTLLLL